MQVDSLMDRRIANIEAALLQISKRFAVEEVRPLNVDEVQPDPNPIKEKEIEIDHGERISIKLPGNTKKRINNLLGANRFTRQNWLIQAITSKLEQDELDNPGRDQKANEKIQEIIGKYVPTSAQMYDEFKSLTQILKKLSPDSALIIIHRIGLFGVKGKTYSKIGSMVDLTYSTCRTIFLNGVREISAPENLPFLEKIKNRNIRARLGI